MRKPRSLVELIDRFGGRDSIKVLFKYREKEKLAEDERSKEITSETSS